MHILQVTPYFPPTWSYGGIPRIVDGLSRALSAKCKVSILTTDVFDEYSRNQMPSFRQENGIDIYTLPNISNRLAYQQQLFLPVSRSHPLQNPLAQIPKIDVIHLHGHRHLLNNMAVRWAQKQKIPYVFTANGTLRRHEQKEWLKILWDQFISGAIPKKAAACIAVSDFDRTVHRNWGIANEKIHTIPNGLDLAEFSQLPQRGFWRGKLQVQEKLIVYLGRISPRKGVDHLVEAFCKGNFQGCTLAIAGNDMGGLALAQAKSQNHPNIHFLGTLGGNERLQLLTDADVLVYASTNEIFGLAPFEGLLSGAPAIVSDDCGCGEIIHKAGAGLLVKYGHIPDIIEKLNILLYSPQAARAMVERGRHYIHQHLRFSVIADQHLKLYASLL